MKLVKRLIIGLAVAGAILVTTPVVNGPGATVEAKPCPGKAHPGCSGPGRS